MHHQYELPYRAGNLTGRFTSAPALAAVPFSHKWPCVPFCSGPRCLVPCARLRTSVLPRSPPRFSKAGLPRASVRAFGINQEVHHAASHTVSSCRLGRNERVSLTGVSHSRGLAHSVHLHCLKLGDQRHPSDSTGGETEAQGSASAAGRPRGTLTCACHAHPHSPSVAHRRPAPLALRPQHCPKGTNTFAHRFHTVTFTQALSQRLVNNSRLSQAFRYRATSIPRTTHGGWGQEADKQCQELLCSGLRAQPALGGTALLSITVGHAVENGCHFVTVAHRPLSRMCNAQALYAALQSPSGKRQAPAFQGVAD